MVWLRLILCNFYTFPPRQFLIEQISESNSKGRKMAMTSTKYYAVMPSFYTYISACMYFQFALTTLNLVIRYCGVLKASHHEVTVVESQ